MWQGVKGIAKGATTFLCGSWAVLFYLKMHLEPSIPEIDRLERIAFGSVFVVSLAWSFARMKLGERSSPLAEPSAAWSGGAVVVVTGLAAAYSLGDGFDQPSDLVFPALSLIATAAIAALVVRFARRNAGQIGEARFRSDSTG